MEMCIKQITYLNRLIVGPPEAVSMGFLTPINLSTEKVKKGIAKREEVR
jgi:hypothetical protein